MAEKKQTKETPKPKAEPIVTKTVDNIVVQELKDDKALLRIKAGKDEYAILMAKV